MTRQESSTSTNFPIASEGFTLVGGRDFANKQKSVPDETGVYAILVRNGGILLSASGYGAEYAAPWSVDDYVHLYTGESWGIRSRLESHLQGTILASNFRETILSIQHGCNAIGAAPEIAADLRQGETWLTDWLLDHALIAFKRCDLVVDVERDLLSRTASPLNIAGRATHPYARTISALRRSFNANPQIAAGRKRLKEEARMQGGRSVRRYRR